MNPRKFLPSSMKQHTQELRGQNAYGALCCSVPNSGSALCRNAGLWRERAHCLQRDTARPLPSTVAQLLPARGQQLSLQQDTCSPWPPVAQAGPEMELKHGAKATTSTSSDSSSQGKRQSWALATAGRGGKGRTGAENGKSQTQVEELLSWREIPRLTLPTKPPQRHHLALMGTRRTARWCSSGSSFLFGPFQPQGWRQHRSHYTALLHEQKTGNQLRLLKHKPSTDKGQALPILTNIPVRQCGLKDL